MAENKSFWRRGKQIVWLQENVLAENKNVLLRGKQNAWLRGNVLAVKRMFDTEENRMFVRRKKLFAGSKNVCSRRKQNG